jgi:hypothetical protein
MNADEGPYAMSTVRGHYNGSVVVLDEPAPVSHEVPVTVEFPEFIGEQPKTEGSVAPEVIAERIRHWEESRARLAHVKTSMSDEVIRQRDLD